MAERQFPALPLPTPLSIIDQLHAQLTARFDTQVTYPIHYRLYNLKQLAYLIKDNEEEIFEAVKEDLGQGEFAVALADLYPVYNEIDLAIKRLPKWMKDETRYMDSMLAFKFMSPRIKKQPKGVALIISPWNFPWQLTMIPLINAIAAGCPAVIKPSELSPSSSTLMARLIPRYLDKDSYAVVMGGAEQTTQLLKKVWGHIIYTGSGRVGKIVARAAADTLTPTTLELGGKSPVIVSGCADIKKTVRRLFTIKQIANGQMCVTPDYILCASERVDELIAECSEVLDTFFPKSPNPNSLLHSPMNACLRSEKEFDRQMSFIDKADVKGKLVFRGEADRNIRRMGFSLVLLGEDGLGESGGLVDEEIFGPVLPIIPVSSMESAISYVKARPHPLALYVCSTKKSVFNKVVEETLSGSVTWNDFAFATFARSLPFGGIGESGWGAYHGYDGFRTFSHFKTTLQVPILFEPLMSLRYPPISLRAQRILTFLLFAGINFRRPESLQDEERRYWWRKWRTSMVLAGLALGLILGASLGKTVR